MAELFRLALVESAMAPFIMSRENSRQLDHWHLGSSPKLQNRVRLWEKN
jgi:hypothetical protein